MVAALMNMKQDAEGGAEGGDVDGVPLDREEEDLG